MPQGVQVKYLRVEVDQENASVGLGIAVDYYDGFSVVILFLFWSIVLHFGVDREEASEND